MHDCKVPSERFASVAGEGLMKLSEYTALRVLMEKKHKEELDALAVKFAKANNRVKSGDVLTDHFQTMVVDDIVIFMDRTNPECIYHGYVLTKKGVYRSDMKRATIYQSNLRTINGEKI